MHAVRPLRVGRRDPARQRRPQRGLVVDRAAPHLAQRHDPPTSSSTGTPSTARSPLEALPPEHAEAVRAVRAVRRGGGSLLSGDVADVLGRPARTYAEWARECYPGP